MLFTEMIPQPSSLLLEKKGNLQATYATATIPGATYFIPTKEEVVSSLLFHVLLPLAHWLPCLQGEEALLSFVASDPRKDNDYEVLLSPLGCHNTGTCRKEWLTPQPITSTLNWLPTSLQEATRIQLIVLTALFTSFTQNPSLQVFCHPSNPQPVLSVDALIGLISHASCPLKYIPTISLG